MRTNIKKAALLIFVYLLIMIPFKVMEIIPGFTDIRPVTMLGPIYALFTGIPGIIIFALMNIVGDIISDSVRWSSIAGLIANFVGPYIVYHYWIKMKKKAPDLKTMKNIGVYSLVVFIAAAVQMAIITPAVAVIYPEVDSMLFALSVVLNNTLFPIVFGIPLIILMKEELGYRMIDVISSEREGKRAAGEVPVTEKMERDI